MKLLKAAFAAAAALTFMTAPVLAAENTDTAQTGSVEVSFPKQSTMAGAAFGIYKIADKVDNDYVLTAEFKNLNVDLKDLKADPNDASSTKADNAKVESLRKVIGAYITTNKISPTKTESAANGKATFANLGEGVYYCAQTRAASDSFEMVPFIATIPFNGTYNLSASAKTTGTVPTTPSNPPTPESSITYYPETRTPSREVTIPRSGMDAWMIPFFAVG